MRPGDREGFFFEKEMPKAKSGMSARSLLWRARILILMSD